MDTPLPASTSLAMLRTWFDISPDAMIAVNQDGAIVLSNEQAERMFGYEDETLLGLPLESLLPEPLRNAHRTHRRNFMTNPRVRPMGIGYELMGVRRDGKSFPVEIGLSPIATEVGDIAIASVRDISETRRVRQALARSRRDNFLAQIGRLALESPDYELAIRRIPELVATALEVQAVAILSTEWHGSDLHVRAATGLHADAAKTIATVFSQADIVRSAFGTGSRHAVTTHMLHEGGFAGILAGLAKAGFPDVAIVPLFGRYGYESLGVLVALATTEAGFDRDRLGFLQSVANLLTAAVQRSRSEEQLAHVQRLDAIGQLTGGVAHDFNNLLTVISGNLQLLESRLPENPELSEIIGSALRAVDRGADLTRRLLTFARKQPLQPRPVVPKPLLEELGHMLRRTLGEAITVEVECGGDVPDVYADANELDTALVNLALNARDAMPRGGLLRIAACEIAIQDATNRWKLPPGRYVAFGVNDTGTGMTPDVLAHALEPFFTTKGTGKGSGLGLSMVYGFVTQSGGGMSIDSRPGYGTSVDFLLPIAHASTARAAETEKTHRASPGRQRTILVVEDEVDVRTVAARFLGANGYEVVAVGCAQDALDLLAGDSAVDLLFSDLVLGSGMNGVELAHEARRVRPGLAVLLTSGYQGKHTGVGGPTAPFKLLRKPYKREQLMDAVRRVLETG
ncbi:PAS domain S-box protein [Rhodanobacter aciditrophus]|uniref:PAS domain S-box protein n=1 Tax=Rhodanobacter aciditrophus TaxID=1623218 RepID=UPI003CFB9BBC